MPVFPALGGKLKSTMPIFFTARFARRRAINFADARGQTSWRARDAPPYPCRSHSSGRRRPRPGGAIEFGNGNHDGRLDRQQAALRRIPLLEGLKFDGMSRDVGHIERGQRLLGSFRIVVRRPSDQREAGERDEGIDLDRAVLDEEFLDGRPRVQTGGEGWNHAQPARFQRLDHPVVVCRSCLPANKSAAPGLPPCPAPSRTRAPPAEDPMPAR